MPGTRLRKGAEGLVPLTYQIVQLDCRYTAIDARYDLLSYRDRVDMVHIQPIAQSRDTRRDLVELHALHAPI